MYTALQARLAAELSGIEEAGLSKKERVITSPQAAHIRVAGGAPVLNFCANNYLGLSDHPALVEAATAAMQRYGYGMSSVRFICGTQDQHKELEAAVSAFLRMDDTILYSSCFDANAGLFETLLGPEDAIVSDSLNHASIIDCSAPKMPSSPIRSTTPASSTASASPRRSATATSTSIWSTSTPSCARPPTRGPRSSWWRPTASSRWTATSLPSAPSATSPRSTKRP